MSHAYKTSLMIGFGWNINEWCWWTLVTDDSIYGYGGEIPIKQFSVHCIWILSVVEERVRAKASDRSLTLFHKYTTTACFTKKYYWASIWNFQPIYSDLKRNILTWTRILVSMLFTSLRREAIDIGQHFSVIHED